MYVPLLPFIEQEPRYQAYIHYNANRVWPAANSNIDPLKGVIQTYLCPSDSEASKPAPAPRSPVCRISYPISWGDAVYNVCESRKNPRGFAQGRMTGPTTADPYTQFYISTSDILDGTSNSLAISEAATAEGFGDTRVRGGVAIGNGNQPSGCNGRRVGGTMLSGTVATTNIMRGYCYNDGRPRVSGFQTILPPNSPSCAIADANTGQSGSNGIMSASSYHPGMVNALVCDASVRPVIDAIDVGSSTVLSLTYNTAASEPKDASPFGIWGAFGSVAGGEQALLP